ncbi:Maf family protein [Eubacteriales bacterium OttesenSCG-928-N14]|nr:Maf family protein [Eubacteriales bacterium OttesenSCG-928-N14]
MHRQLILASNSPRRREYLPLLGLPFVCESKDVDETVPAMRPHKMAMEVAKKKALAVAEGKQHALVLGADTIVVFEGHVLGKPKDAGDAKRMLAALSGNIHRVYTGVCIVDADSGQLLMDYHRTDVKFEQMQECDIHWYVSTGEPLDKAGAYGIQGLGGQYIEWIKGDYFNVLGLPLNLVKNMLKQMGMQVER